jgi:hypothetical protein
MSFAVHTFETNSSGKENGFSFHESIGEGQSVYFLGKFPESLGNAKVVAETIFGTIVETLTNSKIANAYDRFEDALKAGNLEAKQFFNSQEKPEVLIAYFDFHHLYLSVSEKAEAYLVRGKVVSQITETPEKGEDLFLNILSGEVAIEDAIILSSERVLRSLTTNQISDVFARSNFDDAVDIFRHELSTNAEEEILVTVIGVGKKSEKSNFLSKMVSKSPKIQVETSENISELEKVEKDGDEIISEDDFEEEKEIMKESKNEMTIGDLFAKLSNKFSNFRPKKNFMIISGTILGVLLVTIFVRAIFSFESASTQELREQLSIARESLQQADTFLIQGERVQAGEFIAKSEEAIQVILNSKSKNFRSDAQFLLADIQEKKLQIENARKVSPQLLADLGVKNDNLEAVGLLSLMGNLFVYDLNSVYKTVRNIVEKGIPVSGKGIILAASTRKDQNTILFLSDTPQIIEYREGLFSPMGTEDNAWKRGIDIQTYGRYAYVLDPVENQIWKYERKRDKYSAAVAYNQGADLSRGVSIAIDGNIYIIADDGSIQKIFRGTRVDYDFRELPSTPFTGKNLKIKTSAELDFLYILDPENQRVLVFTKGDKFATYKKQVLFEVTGARDFVIDDSGQKVNVLTEDKIYEFSL